MFFEYILHFVNFSYIEILLQIIILFNFFKFLTQKNIFLLLVYFFIYIFFSGVLLIFFECDLTAIILWIIYFGVLIIFFLYAMIWFNQTPILKFNFINFYYLYILFFFFFFLHFQFNIVFTWISFFLINFYSILNFDILNELEILGWNIILFSTFYFLLFSYFLSFVCICIINLNFCTKKIRNFTLLKLFFKLKQSSNFLIFKLQYFSIQNYDNTYQKYSINRNFKISHKINKIKTINRRI